MNSDTPEEEKSTIHWLTGDSLQIALVGRPYLANYNQDGYYRVNYDEENWAGIMDMFASGDLNSVEVTARAQIMDDAFNLARAGLLDYQVDKLNILPLIMVVL